VPNILRQSIDESIQKLDELHHEVISSGLDFGFDQEQIAFQIEGLIFDLQESISSAIKLSEASYE